MKHLTDYFVSSAKTQSLNLEVIEDKTNSKTNENKLKLQSMDSPNDVQNGRKKRKKKLKRNPSDPAVNNIVDLLSDSLTIVSPNTSCSSQLKPKGKKKASKKINEEALSIKSDEVLVVEREDNNSCILPEDEICQGDVSDTDLDIEKNDHLKVKNKLNAFQLMMESRNKSIGQNSPGKDQPCEDDNIVDKKERKEVLSARKNLLKNWSDKKGTSKRKREEEEVEETINYKWQKRAKRLRKLLHADECKNDEIGVMKTRKKRIKRISSSSSENSKNSVLLEDANGSLTNSQVVVIQGDGQDSNLNQSKTKEAKQSLLTFFGVVHNTKKSETIKQIKNYKEKGSADLKPQTSKIKKKEVKSNSCENEIISESLKNLTDEANDEKSAGIKKLKSRKVKKSTNKESDECILEKVKTPKTPKRESEENDENFTPRSLKSWKMRIKINEKPVEKEQEEIKNEGKRPQRDKRVINYSLLFSDESSDEGTSVNRRKSKVKDSETDDVVCLDDSLDKKRREPTKPMKVAPVFTKSTPKPKLPPEVIEARKQFLMSGIPESLKISIEKQQSIEEREYDVFPLVSHVQQKCETQTFWNLPQQQLDLKGSSPLKLNKRMICSNITNSHITIPINIQKEVEKVDKLKTLLNKIKSDNPNYPVYKSFRLIYEKSGKNLEEKKTESKKNKKQHRKDKDIEIVEGIKPDADSIKYAMWTDKYKPTCSEDILGNNEGIKSLKKWLKFWKNFSEEINAKRKKRAEYCSDSEFDTTDCDSRDSSKSLRNTVVVGGPCGSGKSTAIYAICNELDFNVIELNASSKRTGKRLLQELQEATQSHQVRKKEKNMQNYSESTVDKSETKTQAKKMCVLLIEDVDLVFEQDDGFVSALSQLVSSSKRPVVFTTTDTSPAFVQKFISQYEYISFLPLSSQSLATWLQIVCLVEGLFVNQGDIGSLLEFNRGDARRTLLQLQFWVQSGGQIIRSDSPLRMITTELPMEKKLLDDDQEPCLADSSESQDVFVHSDCIKSFEIFRHHKTYRIPYYINLGFLWWNVHNMLGIQSFSEDRIKRFKDINHEIEVKDCRKTMSPRNKKLSPTDQQKLHFLSKFYDSLVFTDVSFRTLNYFDGLEPVVRNYSSELKDSLELGETMDGYNGYKDFVHEITHTLVDGYVEEYSSIEKRKSVLNIAVPDKAERRWRAKMHICEDVFRETLPLSTYLERRAVALDYMPCLRNISRSECSRATNNTKRGNRFRNYLRGLGINYNDNTLKLACNILTANDF